MKLETSDFDSVIYQVLEKYQELFDWVFNNLTEQEYSECKNFTGHHLFTKDRSHIIEPKDRIKKYEILEQQSESSIKDVNEKTTQTEDQDQLFYEKIDSETEKNTRKLAGKRPRGRPRKHEIKPKKKNGQLWEFLLELLNNRETNPSLVRWLSRRRGMFKLAQSEKIAKMWGERRANPKMNYKKMSRTIRHYYKRKLMIPVYGKKLVYQFGPEVVSYKIN